MKVVNIVDTGIFRAIGKPPNPDYDTLTRIVRTETGSVIQLPRPIYRELGGDPDADAYPSGSPYVDDALRAGWVELADPIEETSPVTDAVRDARNIIEAEINHPKTAVLDEDLSLVGLAIQLFERAEAIHINLFTTDDPLRKAATIVVQYYGYYDFDVYFAPPQNVCPDLLHASNFGAGYRPE